LVVVQTAALFLVQKDDCLGGEVLALCGGDGVGGVTCSESGGGDAIAFGVGDLGIGFTVGKDEEAEAVAEEDFTLADPGVLALAGRRGEPVTDKGEVVAEDGKRGVAWVEVAVEAYGRL